MREQTALAIMVIIFSIAMMTTGLSAIGVESLNYSREIPILSGDAGWFILKLNSSAGEVLSGREATINVRSPSGGLASRFVCEYYYPACRNYETDENGMIQGKFTLTELFAADQNYSIIIEVANQTVVGEFTAREIQGIDWAGDWLKWFIHNLIFIVGIILFLVVGWMLVKNLLLR